jgi:predicted regulator of Ras-like GTPase activity (Roadblock/LC7/MglB family)
MATLPQLLEDDIQKLDDVLRGFLDRTDAATALIVDKGGFLITHQGDARQFDLTTISALASGAFMANQTIANLIHETNFDSVYQAGAKYSMFVTNVDEECLLVVIFKASVGVGVVKYYVNATREQIAHQLKIAHERDPEAGLDLSMLNIANTGDMFKRKT